MALKGTLKDFGIADIFQLISHQSKTGVLNLRSKEQEVRIFFLDGNVVRAESATRKRRDLLGAMLVRAEVISEENLSEALDIQKRTLKRLGAILIERGFVNEEILKKFAKLQTTETIYKLFNWESGTYEFETEQVSIDKEAFTPIHSENLLMEGFRMVDEWPMVRKKISSYDMTFKIIKEIPPKLEKSETDEGDVDMAFDSMFDDKPTQGRKSKSVGSNEINLLGLIQGGRNVQKLIDLSQLGEFETCKALHNLILEGFIKSDLARKKVGREKPGEKVRSISVGRILLQTGMYLFIVGLVFLLYLSMDVSLVNLFQNSPTRSFQNPVAREMVGRSHLKRLRSAIEVYKLEHGEYPDRLERLVEEELVSESELRFPWKNPHNYQRGESGYILLRPFE